MMKYFLSSCLLILITVGSTAQHPTLTKDKLKLSYRGFVFQSPRWEVGISPGLSNSFTDIAPRVAGNQPGFSSIYLQGISPALSLNTRYRFNNAFALKFNAGAIMLRARDSWSPDEEVVLRNKSFKNTIYEGSLLTELYLPKRELRPKKDFTYAVRDIYFFSGLSLFYHNPVVEGPVIDEYDQSLLTEEGIYSNFQLAIPLGAGMQWSISNKWVLGYDLNFRYLLFDYLDGFKRPNSTRNDYFFTLNFNIGYVLTSDRFHSRRKRTNHIFNPDDIKYRSIDDR